MTEYLYDELILIDINKSYLLNWYDYVGEDTSGQSICNSLFIMKEYPKAATEEENIFDPYFMFTFDSGDEALGEMYIFLTFHDFHLGEQKSSVYVLGQFVKTDSNLQSYLNDNYYYSTYSPDTTVLFDTNISWYTEDNLQNLYLSFARGNYSSSNWIDIGEK